MYHRIAAAQDMVENSTMAGRYIHPDWGSAANGRPASENGFHSGMCPAARLLPRKQYVGRLSPTKAKAWSTMRTAATMRAGPATGAPARSSLSRFTPRLPAGDGGRAWGRPRRQDEGRPGRLREIELVEQVPEDRLVLPDAGAGIPPPVLLRVESLAVQEPVLDELEIGVERQGVVVDVALPRVGTDQQGRHPHRVAEPVAGRGGDDVVVEAAPVVPGHEDRRGVPHRAAPDRVDERRDPGLAVADLRRGVLAVLRVRDDPHHRRQGAVLQGPEELGDGLDVAHLTVVVHVDEIRQRVPQVRRADDVVFRSADHAEPI